MVTIKIKPENVSIKNTDRLAVKMSLWSKDEFVNNQLTIVRDYSDFYAVRKINDTFQITINTVGIQKKYGSVDFSGGVLLLDFSYQSSVTKQMYRFEPSLLEIKLNNDVWELGYISLAKIKFLESETGIDNQRITIIANARNSRIQVGYDFGFIDISDSIKDNSAVREMYNPWWIEQSAYDYHFGCKLRILECLNDAFPPLWFCIMPPTTYTKNAAYPFNLPKHTLNFFADDSISMETYSTLFFFRPAIQPISDINKLDAGLYKRYVLSPPLNNTNECAPFFIHGLFDKDNTRFDSNIHIKIEQQLAKSGKKVLLLLPYGQNNVQAYRPKMLSLSMVRALKSNYCLNRNTNINQFQIVKTGVAGFSRGAERAMTMWNAQRDDLDELYLFDPSSDALSASQNIVTWLQKNPQRRVRVFNGLRNNFQFFGNLFDSIQKDWKKQLLDAFTNNHFDELKVLPAYSFPFDYDFWKAEGIYRYYAQAYKALSTNVQDAIENKFDELIDVAAPKTELSQKTNIFYDPVKKNLTVPIEAKNVALNDIHFGFDSATATVAEISGITKSSWLSNRKKDGKPTKLSSTKDVNEFKSFVSSILGQYGSSRHQWSMAGGWYFSPSWDGRLKVANVGSPDADKVFYEMEKNFFGHLYMCLRDSNFT